MNEKNELSNVEVKDNGLSIDIDRQQFSLALKTWRLRRGLTQQQLGERWGCSRYTIIKAENAQNITWEMAYKMFARLSEELQKEAAPRHY